MTRRSAWPAEHAPRWRERRDPRAPWHYGRMVTRGRALEVAARLFPDDMADGSDCRAEIGREGEPCRACAERNRAWLRRVAGVRLAMFAAFR